MRTKNLTALQDEVDALRLTMVEFESKQIGFQRLVEIQLLAV